MFVEEKTPGSRRFVVLSIAFCGILLYFLPRNAKLFYSAFENFGTVGLCFLGIILYFYFYGKNYGKLPIVFCKNGTRLEALIHENVPTLNRRYLPLFWCAESRCQTILRTFLPCLAKIEYRRETVKEPNGGQFCLDWLDNESSKRFPDNRTRPTVFILPGVTSTSKTYYVKSIAHSLIESGYRVMVIVNRGLDGIQLTTPQTFCGTHTQDVEFVIKRHRQMFPDAKLFALGASLGSLMLGKYLSEKRYESGLDGAVFFSCPFNAPVCAREVEQWMNRVLINVHIAKEQKKIYRRNSQIFENIVDHEKILNASHMREFDHHFTAPLFGYDSAEHYYEDCIIDQERLNDVKIPLLCVGSNDDMLSPEHGLPKEEVLKTDNVAVIMTHGGGHVSHLQGLNPFGKTYFEQIMTEYLDALMKEISNQQ